MANPHSRFGKPKPGYDPFTAEVDDHRIAYDVFVAGEGPPVVLMHEVDGLKAHVFALGEHLVERGFTVYVPAFFSSLGGAVIQCVRREFVCVLSGRTSPVAGWVTALADAAQQADPSRRQVGVIGMCFTGGLALASLVGTESVSAAVAAQPAMPWASPAWLFPKRRQRDLGLDEEDRSTLKDRLQRGTGSALPVRFQSDSRCPRLRVEEIESLAGAEPILFLEGSGHPTLTLHFRSKGHDGSLDAVNRVADWLHTKLS